MLAGPGGVVGAEKAAATTSTFWSEYICAHPMQLCFQILIFDLYHMQTQPSLQL